MTVKRKQIPLNMWVAPDLKEKFAAVCHAEGRKFNEQFKRIFEEWLGSRLKTHQGQQSGGKRYVQGGIVLSSQDQSEDDQHRHRKAG